MPDPRTLTPGDAHDSPHAEAVVDWEASRLYRLAQSERRAWTVAWAALAVAPVLMSLSVATSAALLTPVATPANLMVMEPGGYEFTDYWKVGLPLLMWYFAVAVLWVPVVWGL